MEIDLTKLSIHELKAYAYDALAIIEQQNKNLQTINAELIRRQQPKKVEEAPEQPNDTAKSDTASA